MELVPLVYTALTVVTVLGAITIIISYISFKVKTKGQPRAKEHTEIIEAERRKAMPARITKMIRKQQKAIQEPRPQKNNSDSRREDQRSRREGPDRRSGDSNNRREDSRNRREDSANRREAPSNRREDTPDRRSNSANRRREDHNRRDENPYYREERHQKNEGNNNRNLPPSAPPPQQKEFYEERPSDSRIRIVKQLKREDGTTQDRDSESTKPPIPNSNKEKSSSKESKNYQSLGDDVIKKYDGEDDDEFFTLDTDDKK